MEQPSGQDVYNSVAGKIDQSFDTFSANFDKQARMLPKPRSDLEQQINNLVSDNQDTLNLDKQGALDQLGGSQKQGVAHKVLTPSEPIDVYVASDAGT